jgi:hypothetical protein
MHVNFGGSGGFSAQEIEEIKRRSADRLRNGVVLPRRPKQKLSGRLTGPYAAKNQEPVDPYEAMAAYIKAVLELI